LVCVCVCAFDNLIEKHWIVVRMQSKNAVSYGEESSTVGDPVLFECKALTADCFDFKKFQ